MKTIFIVIVIASLNFHLQAQINYSKNNFAGQHPRVYLNANDVKVLKEKIESDDNRELWQAVKNIEHPFARALESLITDKGEMSTKAANDFLPMLQACTDGRIPYNEMQMGACIYDWCYYYMSKELKTKYIKEFKRIAGLEAPFYPAQKGDEVLVGHGCEGWLLSDQLPAGLAIYDEDTEMFDAAAKVFFEEFVPVRNFSYRAHMYHQGDSYGSVRFLHDMFATWLFKTIDLDVFDSDQRYVPYQMIYHMRPDGQQLRSGDTFDDAGNDSGGMSRAVSQKGLSFLITGALYGDPYLVDMYENYFPVNDFEIIFDLMILPYKKTDAKPISELPLTKYFPHPMREMIARTGWNMGLDSKDAVIQMRIGNYYFGNHQTKDFGIFQIYYKGPLAISSGVYQGINSDYASDHWKNYLHQTISKNGLLIFDPQEDPSKNEYPYNSVNDGGQRWPNVQYANSLEMLLDKDNGYEMGIVTSHEFGPDEIKPVYSYISGDITNAYTSKVSKVSRSMLTFNTGNDEFPALFLVFDKVQSTQATFKKTWLLHSIEEPEVSGSRFIIKRTADEFSGKGKYSGKLIVQTILPEDASITRIGGKGKEFWIESSQTNYYTEKIDPASEEGAWRIEVSPDKFRKLDYFFHAMAVTNADNPGTPDIDKLEVNNFAGTIIQGYVALFNLEDQFAKQVKFSLNKDVKAIFVAGLDSGSWEIRKDGLLIDAISVSETGNCLYLENGRAGKYEMVIKSHH